jgi:hypothetical protein
MAKHNRNMEGDNEQRRAAARKAREAGERPSEAGATLGASKQLKSAKAGDSHQDKLDLKREADPKRTNRWT